MAGDADDRVPLGIGEPPLVLAFDIDDTGPGRGIDLRSGTIMLTDGQKIPITKYFGPEDKAPAEESPVTDFEWVHSVVAGPDADGKWWSVVVPDEDKELPNA